MPPKPAIAGYTLMELLIVIAVFAMVVVALPMMYAQWRPTVEAKVAVQSLTEAFRAARVTAITEHQETSVVINLSDRTYSVAGEEQLRRFDDEVGLVIHDPKCLESATVAKIRFFADGGSSGCDMTIASGQRSYRIAVQWLTGRVSVADAV